MQENHEVGSPWDAHRGSVESRPEEEFERGFMGHGRDNNGLYWSRVDRRHGLLRRMSVCKRITRWGLHGMRIGEASNPGPKKSSKGVHGSRKRQQRTLLDSDSDAPLIGQRSKGIWMWFPGKF